MTDDDNIKSSAGFITPQGREAAKEAWTGDTSLIEHFPQSVPRGMSDDWQVVEEAHLHREHGGRLNFIQDCDTCNAIARLREREAQLERHDEAATQDAVFFRKRMVRLEEALEAFRLHCKCNYAHDLADRALAHEEEK